MSVSKHAHLDDQEFLNQLTRAQMHSPIIAELCRRLETRVSVRSTVNAHMSHVQPIGVKVDAIGTDEYVTCAHCEARLELEAA